MMFLTLPVLDGRYRVVSSFPPSIAAFPVLWCARL
jgi:hypothetical protein